MPRPIKSIEERKRDGTLNRVPKVTKDAAKLISAPVTSDVPDPPRILKGSALVEWKRTAGDLHRLGLLSSLDSMTLAAYCDACGDWSDAKAALDRVRREEGKRGGVMKGLLVKNGSGAPYKTPLLGIIREARLDMLKFASELGMTPASRARVSVDYARNRNKPSATAPEPAGSAPAKPANDPKRFFVVGGCRAS